MSFYLIPNKRDFKIDMGEDKEDRDRTVVLTREADGTITECKKSEMGFPENTLTIANRFWRPFWLWVNENCHDIFSQHELDGGWRNNGVEVSIYQSKTLAGRLGKAISQSPRLAVTTYRAVDPASNPTLLTAHKVRLVPEEEEVDKELATKLVEFFNGCGGCQIS